MSDIETLKARVTGLGSYLEAHVDGFRGLREVKKFSGGQSNPTFLIDANSGRYVLRSQPPGKLLKSAHAVDREFRVISALSETEVPVAKAYHLCTDPDVLGNLFYVMSFEDGRIYWDPALPDIGETERAQIYDEMNKVLAALHSVDPEAVGLGDYGRPGNYFNRQVARWTDQYRRSETETWSQMDQLMDWLAANLPEDTGQASLIHGDFRIDNMIWHPEQTKVIALLDWELSTLGHPFADIAYQCMQWRMPHTAIVKGLGGLDRRALGIPSEEDYVAKYCERRNIPAIDNWPFYLAFSFFRFAAICQGVRKRAADGNASHPDAMAYGDLVPVLAQMANDILENGH